MWDYSLNGSIMSAIGTKFSHNFERRITAIAVFKFELIKQKWQ